VPLLGDRLRAERERLGLSQQELADLCGVTMRSQRNYEKGERQPDAAYLAAMAAARIDMLYVVTGQRSASVTDRSNVSPTRHLTEVANPVTNELGPTEIDEALMRRIVTMLAKTAKAAGRRWESERLMLAAVDVYKFLAQEDKVDDDKLERVLKLVVNR